MKVTICKLNIKIEDPDKKENREVTSVEINSAKSDEYEETPIHGKHDAVKHAEMSPCFHCRYSEPGTVHMCPGVRCAKYKAWKHTYLQQR